MSCLHVAGFNAWANFVFGGSSLRSVHIILFLCYRSGEAVLTCTQSVEGMGRYISTGDVW